MKLDAYIRHRLRRTLGTEVKRDDLVRQLEIRALTSSAEFIEQHMLNAKPLTSIIEVLDFALEKVSLEGLFCEFGVFQGASINHIARRTKSKVYGFDSFKGLPEAWRGSHPAGMFDLKGNLPKCEDNVELIAGWFDETLPPFIQTHPGKVAFLHVDCDLYTSTKTVFTNMSGRLVSGTVIVFDEYFNYPGWREHEHRAFEEFTRANGLRVEYLCYNRFSQQVAVQIL